LHWPERKLLIVGDAVIGNPPGHCGLLREKVMDDPARLRQSVRQLLDLDFDALLFGDGASILHDAKLRLRDLVATFRGIEPRLSSRLDGRHNIQGSSDPRGPKAPSTQISGSSRRR